MKSHLSLGLVLTLLCVGGCANTKSTQKSEYGNERLPRPDRIWVHDFAATPAGIPSNSILAGQDLSHRVPPSKAEIATGHKAGALVATELVERIGAMGMTAERAGTDTQPKVGDLVIHGYLLAVVKGSATERVALGMGAGASKLKVAVEGFLVTEHGLRRLGSGRVNSGSSETPGAILPAAVTVATANPVGLIVSTGIKVYGEKSGSSTLEGRAKKVAEEIASKLEPRFVEQGWISGEDN